jgi:hypothetical protein
MHSTPTRDPVIFVRWISHFRGARYGTCSPSRMRHLPVVSCRPGVSNVQSYQYLTQVLVYCPIHQITMDITRYSLTKMYKVVCEEIINPAIKLTFPNEVAHWQELQVHLAVVDAADYCIKCPRCALHFASIDSVSTKYFLLLIKNACVYLIVSVLMLFNMCSRLILFLYMSVCTLMLIEI